MNKLNIPKEQLISNSDMTKFVEDVLSDFYKDKDLVEFAKSYNFSSSGILFLTLPTISSCIKLQSHLFIISFIKISSTF